jgi:pimeloyl-ACP methyl ester carboxylesterase
MRIARLLQALALGAALGACHGPREGEKPSLQLVDCRLPGVETRARCGTLEVWEDRKAASGRRIGIRVAVVPAKLRSREPDPMVVFAGGPGQSAVALAGQMMPLFARLNDSRDVLFVDQRGTGESNPLACDEDGPVSAQALFEDVVPERLLRQCLATIQADPRHYVTTTAMADLEEVRAALGYPRLNLWGGSYGSRAALEYLRRYPANVRTAVLDGMAPATMKLPLSFVADGDAAFERLLGSCAKDPDCEGTYPGLRETVAQIRRELARRPVRTGITDPVTGERETILVTENVFLNGLFRPLYVPELASLLPLAITAARDGDFNPLLAQNLEIAEDVSENFAIGMHLSILCAEDIPRISEADLAGLSKSFFGRALVDHFVGACRIWPRGEVPPDYYEPVRSTAPVLILSGGSDPATPPRHGEQVAAALPNARHIVAPHLGHGVSMHGCAPKLIEQFVRAGNAAVLDARCLERIPRPLFVRPLAKKP